MVKGSEDRQTGHQSTTPGKTPVRACVCLRLSKSQLQGKAEVTVCCSVSVSLQYIHCSDLSHTVFCEVYFLLFMFGPFTHRCDSDAASLKIPSGNSEMSLPCRDLRTTQEKQPLVTLAVRWTHDVSLDTLMMMM